ncbi:MAG: hypothetical protein H6709_09520 [Kofleriaceae bacterium]|nr:hypothetical protein [Kofleriaceae bacterium]MCB9572310.1 hypothetical protein [Kofleriaceae bacterium]
MRRLALAVAAITLAGCDPPPPTVTVAAPRDGTVITSRDPVRLDVVVRGPRRLRGLRLVVAGQAVTAEVTPTLAGRDCRRGCDAVVWWPGDEAREGTNRLELVVTDERGRSGAARLAMRFEDAPRARLRVPASSDQLGVGRLVVTADVVDRGVVRGTVEIDGTRRGAMAIAGDCRRGCVATWPWDTRAETAGRHHLAVTLVDQAGRTTALQRDVVLGDAPYVRAIEVTGERDFGALDVEVHVVDAHDVPVACAGAATGLAPVDRTDVRYAVDALLIRRDGQTLGTLPDGPLRVRVTEDDADPCPVPPGRSDDLIGTSPALPAAELLGAPLSFDDVVYLELASGRPLRR